MDRAPNDRQARPDRMMVRSVHRRIHLPPALRTMANALDARGKRRHQMVDSTCEHFGEMEPIDGVVPGEIDGEWWSPDVGYADPVEAIIGIESRNAKGLHGAWIGEAGEGRDN